MAQYSYEQYAAKQEARKNNQANGDGQRTEVHFMGEFLRNDGDVAVVRFPYRSMADVNFETVHNMPLVGRPFGVSVRCADENCPLCAQGIETKLRFFCKATVYIIDEATGTVKPLNAVWDRPSAFADIEIKNLIQEYGDLTQYLFKIKRTGSGPATRYTISIIMNTTVYNPEVYKPNFEELNSFDAKNIVSRSIQQYNEALNPSAKSANKVENKISQPIMNTAAPAQPVYAQPVQQAAPAYQTVNQQPVTVANMTPQAQPPVDVTSSAQVSSQTAVNYQQPAATAPVNQQPVAAPQERKQVRYQF